MKQAVEDLPDYYRLPVLLADVEGFSYSEIAEILDVPIGTVMSRLHRGRKQLHKRLYDFAARNRLLSEEPDEPDDRTTGVEPWRTTATTCCRNDLHVYLDGEATTAKPEPRSPCTSARAVPSCADAFHFEAQVRRVVARCCCEEPVPESLRVRVLQAIYTADP